MTKFLQFLGGFILSFLLIVGLFTGIIWYTKEYTPPPPPEMNLDSLLAAGVLPESLNIFARDSILLRQQRERMEAEKAELERKKQEIAQRQQMLEDIKAQLEKASAEEDSIMELRYADLAQLIESMKPVNAGVVMNNLSDFSAAKILVKMRKREAGRVMNSMDPDKLARVSQLLTMLKE